MVIHPSRVSESGAMKPTIPKIKFLELAKTVENLFVGKPDFSKFQTKTGLYFIQEVSV